MASWSDIRAPAAPLDAAPGRPVLLGRARECARLEEALARARAGRGETLVLLGEGGIGKTTLLDHLATGADDFLVLRTQGVQAEATLAYSGLLELLGPLLRDLDGLPGPQAEALRRGLGLGERAAAELYLAYAAVLQLLTERAEACPVLCLVDDAHWLDAVSAEGLSFVARRLSAERVAMIFASRAPDEGALDLHGVEALALDGLDREAARELLAAAGEPLAPGVADALIAATQGNPLALLETPALLTDDQRAGAEPLDEPLSVGRGVERAFLSRAGALSGSARQALLLAAASAIPRIDVIACASPGAAEGLDEAEAAGLVRVRGGDVAFRHPLVRSAIYAGATSGEKRAAHAALAAALAGDPEDRDLWHRAAATVGGDHELADALDAAAERAAMRCLVDEQELRERAARLTRDPDLRVSRLLRAGMAAHGGGRTEHAIALLEEGLEATRDPLQRADLLDARLAVADAQGNVASQLDRCLSHAAATEHDDPVRAQRLTCRAWLQACDRLDLPRARALAAVATRRDTSDDAGGGTLGLAARARHGLLDADAGVTALAAARRGAARELDAARVSEVAVAFAEPLLVLGDHAEARRLLEHVIDRAGARGSTLASIRALCVASELELRCGQVAQARVAAERAVELALDEAPARFCANALAARAAVQAVLGDPGTRATVEAAVALAVQSLDRGSELRALDALGRFELGAGDAEAAAAALVVVERTVPSSAPAGLLRWRPDLIEAYVRLDRHAEAAGVLDRLCGQAARYPTAWAAAAVARCRALVAGELEAQPGWAEAAALAAAASPFELARTELAWGARLRRGGRRTDARGQLQAALAGFERLGAGGWAERTRDELRATGARVRASDPAPVQKLTARELEVSLLAATGATNREIGARLFLSAKTVEVHLGRAYRKLGVRSRTELARVVPAG